MKLATEFVDTPAAHGHDLRRQPGLLPREHARGTACARVPLPGSKYCQSHKHLDEELEVAAADEGAEGRSVHPVILGVDVGGTFTDAALLAGDRLVDRQGADRRRRTNPRRDGRGRGGARRRRRLRWRCRALRPRHDRRHERAARGSRGAHGSAGDGGLHRPRGARPSGPRRELYRLCAGHPPRSSRPSCESPCPSAPVPRGCCARWTRTPCGWRSTGSTPRRRPSASCGDSATPSTSSAWRAVVEEARPGIHVSTSHETAGVFREYERCATTVVDAALSPLLRGYLERLTERAREAGLPEPEVMLRAAAPQARAPRPATPPGPCCRPGRRSRGAVARPRGERRRHPADGRAASADRARHGRDLVRRLADRRRGRRRRAAGARSAGARSRCRWWTCTPSAPAAARSPGATPAARCAWGRARPGRIRARRATAAAATSPP